MNTEPKHNFYFIEIRISDKCSFFSLFNYLVDQWICMVIRINRPFRRHDYFFICFIRDDVFPAAHIIEQNKTRTFDGKRKASDAKGCCVSSLITATSNSFVFSSKALNPLCLVIQCGGTATFSVCLYAHSHSFIASSISGSAFEPFLCFFQI